MRPRDLGVGGLYEHVRDAMMVALTDVGPVVLRGPSAKEIFGHSPSAEGVCPPWALPPKGRAASC